MPTRSGRSLEPGAPSPSGVIPLSEPNISGREWQYVRACLDSGWVSSVGSYVTQFETEFASAVGASFAVAMSSGTAALHVALLVAGIRPEDEVVLPALTFIAPANAVRYVGAWPVFIDVDSAFWQMDAAALRRFLDRDCRRHGNAVVDRATGRAVRAVIPVDILGHPCDLDAINAVASEFGLVVIEDATESVGALYKSRPLGSISPVTCFSFNGNKLLTTGGGGMLVTNDEALATRARYLSTQAKDDPLEFVHNEIGFNYRLTNVQAAIGCAQLERLAEFVIRKREIAGAYAEGLRSVPGVRTMAESTWARSAFWMYTILVEEVDFGCTSRDLMRALERDGIKSRPLWQPLNQSPAHAASGGQRCPISASVHLRALSLPCSTGLSQAAQQQVITAIHTRHREAAAT